MSALSADIITCLIHVINNHIGCIIYVLAGKFRSVKAIIVIMYRRESSSCLEYELSGYTVSITHRKFLKMLRVVDKMTVLYIYSHI